MCLKGDAHNVSQLDVTLLQPDRETDLQCGGLTRVQMVGSGGCA